MDRVVAAVLALALALPIVLFVAAGLAAGISPSIYSGAIGFLIGLAFVSGVVLELRRLVNTPSEDLLYGWMPRKEPAPLRLVTTPPAEDATRVEVIREPAATTVSGGLKAA